MYIDKITFLIILSYIKFELKKEYSKRRERDHLFYAETEKKTFFFNGRRKKKTHKNLMEKILLSDL